MGELGWNKIFFSIIAAGLIILGLKEVSAIAFPSGYGHGHGHEDDDHGDVNAKLAKEYAYFVPVESGPVEPVEVEVFDLGAALVSADLAAGERVMRSQCSTCHNWNEGEANKTGPLLYDLFGHPVGGQSGFNYSATFREKEGDWTYEKLDAFLKDPRGWAPGTSMGFAGLRRDSERANVIAFIASVSPSAPPPPSPAAAEEAAVEEALALAGEPGMDAAEEASVETEEVESEELVEETAEEEVTDGGEP